MKRKVKVPIVALFIVSFSRINAICLHHVQLSAVALVKELCERETTRNFQHTTHGITVQ